MCAVISRDSISIIIQVYAITVSISIEYSEKIAICKIYLTLIILSEIFVLIIIFQQKQYQNQAAPNFKKLKITSISLLSFIAASKSLNCHDLF